MAEYIERQSVLAKKFNLESRLHETCGLCQRAALGK